TEEKEQRSDITKLLPQQVYSASSDELYKDDYLESGTWDVIGVRKILIYLNFLFSLSKTSFLSKVCFA
ncbi:unnamed protein product, partial [Adineta steineri]